MSEPFPTHICFYSERLSWGPWERSGALAERLARRVPICTECGRERPSIRPRPAVRREVRAEVPVAPPLADEAGRTVATVLVRRGGHEGTREIGAIGLLGSLAHRGVPASLAEEWLDHFLAAGWIEGRWLVGRGGNRLDCVWLRDREALRELAQPGIEARRRAALAAAREQVAALTHPKAREIAALLNGEEAETLAPNVVAALAAVAVHVEADEPMAERVFSTRFLGDSKALAAVRGRLERLLGPLSELGIREGAGVTLLGGRGTLQLSGIAIDLSWLAPFAGFSRQTLEHAEEIRFPPGGLLVVENLTAFEACCRGEVPGSDDAFIVWSAGYPGRAVRRIVTAAGAAGARVRVWADLDLDGVRIARLISSWAASPALRTVSNIAPWRMDRGDLSAAPVSRPLPPRAAAAILRDLEERPTALLADTLQALLETRTWVEQEAFLAQPGQDSAVDS
ncbi:MAG TPA: DUF2399 domain-containing protein [Thermoanaerobaculia bacterium]|jgi:hypothetical protein|nr:DUF2399 domain-containing protein [Thermoanaerobaculia bacterium]